MKKYRLREDETPDDDRPPEVVDRTSDILEALVARIGAGGVTVGEIVSGFRNRAFGLLLVVFGVPCMLPAPPPIPLICASVVILVALNMIGGHATVWVPDRMARRSMPADKLAAVLRRFIPVTRRIEKLCRPRFLMLSDRPARRVLGVMLIITSIILLLPIPMFGNFGPGLAIAVTGLGLSERDGWVLLASLLISVVAGAFTLALAWASYEAVVWFF